MYKLLDDRIVRRLADGALIPFDPENGDYQEYLAWIDDGNQPEPADPPPTPDHTELRRLAYQTESDPLFFKAQRGEATLQDWLDKVAEIKTRYPE